MSTSTDNLAAARELLALWVHEDELRRGPARPVLSPAAREDARVAAYATAALERECSAVAGEGEGNRNNRLNTGALVLGQLVAGGSLSRDLVEGRLLEAAGRCGLPEPEALLTIRSGLNAGARQPRRAPEANGHAPRPKAPPPAPAGEESDGPRTGYQVILEWAQERYQPTFRVGLTAFHSATLGHLVKITDAAANPPIALIDRLELASDAPRLKGGQIDRQGLPQFHGRWCRSALGDMVASLREEDQESEVSAAAEDDFRLQLARALTTIVSLGNTYQGDGGGEETRVERRSLLQWAALWAKPGPWKPVRSYALWCRRDEAGLLRICLRVELFGTGQLPNCSLRDLPARKFALLCAHYRAGAAGDDARPCGQRAVELLPAFVAGLLTGPALPVAAKDEVPDFPGQEEGQDNRQDLCNDW